MEWVIELNGDKDDLEILPKYFNFKELYITEEEGRFFLRSSYLSIDKAFTEEDVIREGRKLLISINGISRMLLKAKNLIEFHSILKLDNNGKLIKGCTWINCKLYVRNSGAVKLNGKEINPKDYLEKWTKIILSDKDVMRAFLFLSLDNVNWRDLYCIYDTIQENVGGRKIVESWFPKRKLERFTQTACSFEAIKENARHSMKKIKKPKIEMSLLEASSLVYDMLCIWLEKIKTK
jgi:hypothetical protein